MSRVHVLAVKKAIFIAKKNIECNQKFIKEVEEENKNNPDISKEQLGNRVNQLVTKMVDFEIITLKKILKELEPKTVSRTKTTVLV